MSDLSSPRQVAVVVVVAALLGGILVWRLAADPAPTDVTAPTAGSAGNGFVGYVVTQDGAVLSTNPGEAGTAVAGGLIFPVTLTTNGDYEVLDNCNRPGWVPADQVDAGSIPIERERQMDRSVFVIDPGHGAPDLGAVGPGGLAEAEANIDVSARVIDLLGSAHDIDWASGTVTSGDAVPAAAVAIMTRYPDGPNGGDYELGLTFRATMGNAVDATALVSIHHNTEPTMDLDFPGTSAFVSVSNEESPRLGGLIVDEVRRSFSEFEADWVGGRGSGLVTRVGADGEDYYSILARAEQPAVIVEGAYISNPTEEALIMTDAFRQAYAEGVYRGLVRYVTTDDNPIPAPDPELYDLEAPPRSMDDCVVPQS
ncbi:MAG TPA: N-acetylmuramoyl-L-alanine amidase [Acidimicrobiia bacterium]|nr:N-acetylmuramoyl-L-alanine amidase [Acidimicrobiia bacterium]